jgi:hypothetical protein
VAAVGVCFGDAGMDGVAFFEFAMAKLATKIGLLAIIVIGRGAITI